MRRGRKATELNELAGIPYQFRSCLMRNQFACHFFNKPMVVCLAISLLGLSCQFQSPGSSGIQGILPLASQEISYGFRIQGKSVESESTVAGELLVKLKDSKDLPQIKQSLNAAQFQLEKVETLPVLNQNYNTSHSKINHRHIYKKRYRIYKNILRSNTSNPII